MEGASFNILDGVATKHPRDDASYDMLEDAGIDNAQGASGGDDGSTNRRFITRNARVLDGNQPNAAGRLVHGAERVRARVSDSVACPGSSRSPEQIFRIRADPAQTLAPARRARGYLLAGDAARAERPAPTIFPQHPGGGWTRKIPATEAARLGAPRAAPPSPPLSIHKSAA